MTIEEQLIRDEGLRLKPYRDTVGKLTLGVGRNLDDRGISKEEADFMLANDIAQVKEELTRALPWWQELDEVRQAVLINMGFNLGVLTGNPPKLLTFMQTLAAIRAGNYGEAALGMLASKWATQVGDRAKRLARQMELGTWQ